MKKAALLSRGLAIAVLIASAFWIGHFIGSRESYESTFHDMHVNDPDVLLTFVTPADRRIVDLAHFLKTPESAYEFVRDRIEDDPALPALPAGDILVEGRASCLGKAILLVSLYRALGIHSDSVRAVTGEVEYPYGIVEHAWVDMEYKGQCFQQDTTNLLGKFGFSQFSGRDYTRSFIRKETFAFNDTNFVVVSRRNMMQGADHSAHPAR